MSANIPEKAPRRPTAFSKTISFHNEGVNNRDKAAVAEKRLWVDKIRNKLLEEASHPEHGLRIVVGHANLLNTLESIPRDHDRDILFEQRFKSNIDAPTKDTRCNQHYYHDGRGPDSWRNLTIYSGNNKRENYSNDELEILSSEFNFMSDNEISWSSLESPESDSSSDSEYDWPEIYKSAEAELHRLTIVGFENSE